VNLSHMFFCSLNWRNQSQNAWKRTYAQLCHRRPIVVQRYKEEPRDLVAETRPLTESGKSYWKEMRKLPGASKRIPGLLMLANKDPIYLKMNPSRIKTFLTYDNFLGKRYNLTVDDETTYEVIPQYIGVHPVSREPESVTFSLWTGVAPKPIYTEAERKKVRPWEEAYLNEQRLKKDLLLVHNAMKEKFTSLEKFEFEDDPLLAKTYNIKARKEFREKHGPLMDEVRPLLSKFWNANAKVMILDKEDMNPDDPHAGDEEEGDEDEGADEEISSTPAKGKGGGKK